MGARALKPASSPAEGRGAGLPVVSFERYWWVLPLAMVAVGAVSAVTLPSRAIWLRWGGGPMFAVLVLLSTVLHELGHVVAAVRAGHRWAAASVTWFGMSVTIEPTNPAGWDRISRSAAGPAVQVVAGLLMTIPMYLEPWNDPQALAAGFSWWPVWLAGIISAGVALANLIPVRNLDGAKIIAGIKQLKSGAGLQESTTATGPAEPDPSA